MEKKLVEKGNQVEEKEMIELFLQGEGLPEIKLVRIPVNSRVEEILSFLPDTKPGEPVLIMSEEGEEFFETTAVISSVPISHRDRIHAHRCGKITVNINYNGETKTHIFSPSVPIKRVHQWAVGEKGFNLSRIDATEHALQVCNNIDRPYEDIHLGALTKFPECSVCFDLVPKKRVEGLNWKQ